ncbi:hypothetical protein SEA_SORORFAGO_64 [Mycobacterium phage SororFago]|nr:hypothetical protein SEA_SORORFAGO_64 [Mycobacterium phage SororFago]
MKLSFNLFGFEVANLTLDTGPGQARTDYVFNVGSVDEAMKHAVKSKPVSKFVKGMSKIWVGGMTA